MVAAPGAPLPAHRGPPATTNPSSSVQAPDPPRCCHPSVSRPQPPVSGSTTTRLNHRLPVYATPARRHPPHHFICVALWLALLLLLCLPSRLAFGHPTPTPTAAPASATAPTTSPSPAAAASSPDAAAPAPGPVFSSDYSYPPTLGPQELQAVFDVWTAVSGESDWPSIYPDPCYGPTGITCDPSDDAAANSSSSTTYHVTSLHLGATSPDSTNILCSATATIHPSLFTLTHLTALHFVNCFTTTPYTLPPTSFANLSALQLLSFQNNPALVGPLPPSIGSIPTLQRLILLQNRFHGRLPPSLGTLPALSQLELYSNRFVGPIPPALGDLRNLVLLDLSSNGFTGPVPDSLGRLANLQMLDLGGNNLDGPVPASLGALRNLVVLDLGDNNLFGGLPDSFAGLTKLQDLVVAGNPMGGAPLPRAVWPALVDLVVLDAGRAGFTGPVPAELGALPSLRYLALDGNNFTGALPPALADLAQVQKLNVSGNSLAGPLLLDPGFVQRLGKNLGVQGNPGLCYPPALQGAAVVLGLLPCTEEQMAGVGGGVGAPAAPRPLLALPVSSSSVASWVAAGWVSSRFMVVLVWVLLIFL